MDTVYVNSREALARCRRSIEASWWCAVDLETNGLSCHDNDILLIQLCGNHDGVPYVIPRHHLGGDEEALRRLLQLLKERVWIGHNLAFDAKFMYVHFGLLPRMLWDTLLAEQVLRAGLEQYSCDLEATVYRHLGVKLDKTFQRSFVNADPQLFVPTQAQIEYAGEDVALLHKLRELQLLDIKDHRLLAVALMQCALLPPPAKMHPEDLHLYVH